MGKRRNKNKNKNRKLLNYSSSEKKPGAVLKQDCTKERQAEQNSDSKNNPKVDRKFGNGSNRIKNLCMTNEYVTQKSNVIKFPPTRNAFDITKSQIMYENTDAYTRQHAAISSIYGLGSKQEKKIISNSGINENEYHLCEDLFSYSSESDDDCTEFHHSYDSAFFYSKNIFYSGIKEKCIEQTNKNNLKASETKDCAIYQKSRKGKTMIKNISSELVSQDSTIASNTSNNTECKRTQDYAISSVSGVRPKHNRKAISNHDVKEYERKQNFEQKLSLREKTSKESFIASVNEYSHSKNTFLSMYHKWLPERRSTLEKLQSLYEEVKNDRIKYNEAQVEFKKCSVATRTAKLSSDSMLLGFFASAVTLMVDATSGISSFSHAYNTDCFKGKFQEIMDHDAEITKDLYEIRSQCVAEYQGIEEVMRKFHTDTLSSTVNKISDTLEAGKYWEAMKGAYKNDDMSKLTDIVGNFFKNACQSEVLKKVCDSVETYVSDNTAIADGYKSTGKAIYESVNTWSPIYTRNSLRGRFDNAVSRCLIYEDIEAYCLKENSNEYCSESKIESQINDAIDSLETEMEEICNTYCNAFNNEIHESEIFFD